eukprot:evm.model.NODE_31407_length_6906_cov_18.941210.2
MDKRGRIHLDIQSLVVLFLLLAAATTHGFYHPTGPSIASSRKIDAFQPYSRSLLPAPTLLFAPLPPHQRQHDHLEGRQWQLLPLAAAGGKGFGKKNNKEGEGESSKQQPMEQETGKADTGPDIIRPTFSQQGRREEAAKAAAAANGAAASSPSSLPSRKFQMLYTCNICEGRNLIQVDRIAFTEGIVVARCKHCDAKHLVADNLSKLDFGGVVGKGAKEGEAAPTGGGKVTLNDLLAASGQEAKYLDIKSNPQLAEKYDLVVLEDGTVELAPKEKNEE